MLIRRGFPRGSAAERYGGVLVYEKYDTPLDGRGATSIVKVTDAPPVVGANDVEAVREYLAAQQPR